MRKSLKAGIFSGSKIKTHWEHKHTILIGFNAHEYDKIYFVLCIIHGFFENGRYENYTVKTKTKTFYTKFVPK